MQITIVGGGFGGVKTALELAKNKHNNITLISDKADFQYYPALYSTATGRTGRQSWVPLGEIFGSVDNVDIVIDKIVSINKSNNTISGESGINYEYTTLVLALGSVTTYFGIPGLDQYSYGIKSEAEINELKQHLVEQFTTPGGTDEYYLIIGGGPTGVELASSLGSYLKHLRKRYRQPGPKINISIIEAAPRILPRMSEEASKLVTRRLRRLGVHVETNKKVEAETADGLIVNGRAIKSQTVVWTSGVANNPFYAANPNEFELSKNGKVTVDGYMRADKNVYVIGDNAFTPFSGLAQTALHDAKFIAKHIAKKAKKKYEAKTPPVVVPVGDNWAIFEYKWIKFDGWVGSLLRSAADFVGYWDILPFWQALSIWRAQDTKESAPLKARSKS